MAYMEKNYTEEEKLVNEMVTHGSAEE